MKVLLISSCSVSVHVSAKVHQRLLDDGHEVMHFLTENAHTLCKHLVRESSRLLQAGPEYSRFESDEFIKKCDIRPAD